jgi:hypothetical protein
MHFIRLRDNQHNDTRQNDNQSNDIQHNIKQHNTIQNNNCQIQGIVLVILSTTLIRAMLRIFF